MTKVELQDARQRVKKRLSEYLDVKREYAQVLEKLKDIEAIMTSPRAQKLDGMPRGGSGGDPMSAIVAQHITLEERYREQLWRLAEAQCAVEEMIESLEPGERKLMRHRYIDGLSWERVCVAMSYSWRATHNIHARALDKLAEKEYTQAV